MKEALYSADVRGLAAYLARDRQVNMYIPSTSGTHYIVAWQRPGTVRMAEATAACVLCKLATPQSKRNS